MASLGPNELSLGGYINRGHYSSEYFVLHYIGTYKPYVYQPEIKQGKSEGFDSCNQPSNLA